VSDGSDRLSRRLLLQGLAASAALPGMAWAEAPSVSPRPVARPGPKPVPGPEALIASAKLTGVLGYAVIDSATGALVEGMNEAVALPPASVVKAVTALYALEKLGPDHRFRTRLLRRGALAEGRLDGDLVLMGGADPTLDTDRLADLVAALAATGLRQVNGHLLVCPGSLPSRPSIAPDQPEQVGYNPAVSGLMLNFNRVNFLWKPQGGGWDLRMEATGERFMPPVSMADMAVVARREPLFTYAPGEGRDHWTVAEPALGEGGSRWLPVRHPLEYSAEVFATLCAAQGISLPAADLVPSLPADLSLLTEDVSPPLEPMLRGMLRYSTNLTAEVMGLTASAAGTQLGSATAMGEWARRRFGVAAQFGDHSGLGPRSRISARDMAQLLSRAGRGGRGVAARGILLRPLLREHGLADAEGKERPDHPTRILSKSGTLNFVSGLAGYIRPAGGRELCFAIFAADVPRREALPLADREAPEGGVAWNRRARKLHQLLIRRWVDLYA
jgi:D-alanyl-D-alanine carboxypeptidase/D-alanyl-D-alanine-endopeptidase (penicillin-binding protein 4)